MSQFKTPATKIIVHRVCPECKREYDSTDCDRCVDDGSLLASVSAANQPLEVINDLYKIESVLASGGWGKVYSAIQQDNGRTVAIKIMQDHFLDDPSSVARFQQEAEAAGALSDPRIVTMYDYGLTTDGVPYLVMELCDGISLAEMLARDKQVGWQTALKILKDAASALQTAHQRGIVHRDIKPSNIMIAPETFEAKLLDFGVAKILASNYASGVTGTGEAIPGTAAYMSPEQCHGHAADPRSDIYALGCVAYEMLSGQKPVEGRNIFELLHKHQTGAITPLTDPAIPADFKTVVLKCLAKSPEQRYQSCTELLADLGCVEEGVPLKSFQTPAPSKSAASAHTPAIVMLILLVCTALSGLVFTQSITKNPQPPSARASRSAQKPVCTAPELSEQNTSGPIVVSESTELGIRLQELLSAAAFFRSRGEHAKALKLEESARTFEQLAKTGPTGPVTAVAAVEQGSDTTPLNQRGNATVVVSYTNAPVTLVLTSPKPVSWNIKTVPGAKIERVKVFSDYTQQIKGLPEKTKIELLKFDEFPGSVVTRQDRKFDNFMRFLHANKLQPDTFSGRERAVESAIEIGPVSPDWLSSYAVNKMESVYQSMLKEVAATKRPRLEKLRATVLAPQRFAAQSKIAAITPFSMVLTDPSHPQMAEAAALDPRSGKCFYAVDGTLKSVAKDGTITEIQLPRGFGRIESLACDTKRNRLLIASSSVFGRTVSALASPGTKITPLCKTTVSSVLGPPTAICYSPHYDRIFVLPNCSYNAVHTFMELSPDGEVLKTTRLSRPISSETVGAHAVLAAAEDMLLLVTDGNILVIDPVKASIEHTNAPR